MSFPSVSMAARITLLIAAAAGLMLMFTSRSQAVVIDVNTASDQVGMAAGCSLRQAISAADLDSVQGGCAAGSGADTIKIPGGNYSLTIPGAGETINNTGDLNVQGGGALTLMPASNSPVVIDAAGIDRVISHGGPGQLSIHDLTIRGGRLAVAGGGAILNKAGNLTLDGVTVSGNEAQAGAGGGIFNEASVTIVNSTIAGNSAKASGGGYFGFDGSVANVRSTTITDNTTDSLAANAGNGGGIAAAGTVNSFNTVIAGNHDNSPMANSQVPDCSTGPKFYPRYTLIGVSSPAQCLKGFDAGTNLTGDPGLGSLADHGGMAATVVPLTGSLLIDAGGAAAPDQCPPVDQRGVIRPKGSGCDIGAVEFDPAGLDNPDQPGIEKAGLKMSKLGPKVTRARDGDRVAFRIRVRNISETTATGIRLCLTLKGKAARTVRPAGKRCRQVGALIAGSSRTLRMTVRVKKNVPRGRSKISFVVKADNATTRKAGAALRIG